MNLWKNVEQSTQITFYKAQGTASDAAVVIFPGGGYSHRAEHEGKGYAEFLQANGINAFVVDYRVSPATFPLPLLDARRAVKFVRFNAEEFGIDPHKIAVMGSSAGGHLAAMLSTYTKAIPGEGAAEYAGEAYTPDEIDGEDYLPDAQILCYPVLLEYADEFAHKGSYIKLLGEDNLDFAPQIDPVKNASPATPQAFIWHTAADPGVNVINSYEYAKALRINEVPVEMHIFPNGKHGLGLAKAQPHVAQWSALLIEWFKEIGWTE